MTYHAMDEFGQVVTTDQCKQQYKDNPLSLELVPIGTLPIVQYAEI
jgi:hypothetical protein